MLVRPVPSETGGERSAKCSLSFSTLRTAFTIVELLVVIAILGILIALLLPAIQAARESARQTTCKNHLKQIGLAVQNELSAQGHFPSGGWGFIWTGDPDRGFGEDQPGSWVYSVLPYLEEQNLHALGTGQSDSEKKASAALRMESVLPMFNCPTRRPAVQYDGSTFWHLNKMVNADAPRFVSRSDYAINVGTSGSNGFFDGGPKSYAEAATYIWPRPEKFTGLSFAHSEVEARQVTDGMSHTILVGEKYVNPQLYETCRDPSDWGHIFGGFSEDNFRMGGIKFRMSQDKYPISRLTSFGSAHQYCHFVFCDASVQAIDFEIDGNVYEYLINREDGEVISGLD